MSTETELERLVVRLVMKSGHKGVLDAAIRDFKDASADVKGVVKIMEASVETSLKDVVQTTRSQMREAAAVIQKTRTPYENFAADMSRLDDLYRRNFIGQESYNRAVSQLRSTLPGVSELLKQNAKDAKEIERITKRNETAQESYLRQSKRLKDLLSSGLDVDVYRRELATLQSQLPGAVARQKELAAAEREHAKTLQRAASLVKKATNDQERYDQAISDLRAGVAAGTVTAREYLTVSNKLWSKLPEQVEATRKAEQAQEELNEQLARAKELVSNQTPAMRAYAQGLDDLQVALHHGAISEREFTKAAEELRQTLPEQVAAARAAEQAHQELSQSIQRGVAVAKSFASAEEKYEAALIDLRAALNAGEIPQQHFNRAVDQLTPKLPGLSDRLQRVRDDVRAMSQSMVALGQRMSFAVTLPVAAAGAAFVKFGSDAIETKNKFVAVFSNIQGAAQRTANSLDESFGLASSQARKLLADTGDLLTGFGFSQRAALDMSNEVQRLSADLASFTNIEGGVERASHALTSALLGEREAAKSLGIAILENDVKDRVALLTKQGMTFANERAAKAYATLRIAIDQSKNAIGDYARTSKEFANQFREMKGDIKDVAEGFGELLLPAASMALSLFRDGLKWVKNLSRENKLLIATLATAAAAVGPLLIAVGSIGGAIAGIAAGLPVLAGIASSIAPAIPVVLAVVGALAAVGAATTYIIGPDGLASAWRTAAEATSRYLTLAAGFFANFRENVASITEWIRTNWTTVLSSLPSIMAQVGTAAIKSYATIIKTFQRIFVAFGGWLVGQFNRIWTSDLGIALVTGLGNALGIVIRFQNKLPQILAMAATGLGSHISDLFSDMLGGIDKEVDLSGQIKGILGDAASEIKANLGSIDLGLTGPKLNLSLPSAPKLPAGSRPQIPTMPAMDTADATKAAEAHAKVMERGKQIIESNRTALQIFNDKKADLLSLLRVGAIDQGTYGRAVAKASDEYKSALESLNKPTAEFTARIKAAKEALSIKGRRAKEGAKIKDDLATPVEKYKERMKELRSLLADGSIDLTTFGRATKQAVGDLSKATPSTSRAAVGGINAVDARSPEALRGFQLSRERLNRIEQAKRLAAREMEVGKRIKAGAIAPPSAAHPASPKYTARPATPTPGSNAKDNNVAAWQREDVVNVVEFLRAIAHQPPLQVADF